MICHAVLHVRQLSVTLPTYSRRLSSSFPPPEITLTSCNLGRTIFLIVVKGRLGAAQSVNATRIKQRLTLPLLFVPLVILFLSLSTWWRLHREGTRLNESVTEHTKTSRMFTPISDFGCMPGSAKVPAHFYHLYVMWWQSRPCFSMQEHWDSSRFSQSTPPHKHSAHSSHLLLQTSDEPPLPAPLLPQPGRMRMLDYSVSAVFQSINEFPQQF